jgi:cytochrome oxidase Cu insertion factor (SCO1/SenC/PrrC family)
MRKVNRRGSLVLLITLVFLLVAGCSTTVEPGQELELLSYDDDGTELVIEEVAPNFSLTNLAGESISLEDYRGQIVLLTFFSST